MVAGCAVLAVMVVACSPSRAATSPPTAPATSVGRESITTATTTPTSGPTVSSASTVASVPTPTSAAPVSAPPYPVVSTVVPLVDPSRPTVSHGTVVATSRTLTTLVWAPATPGRWPLVVFGHGFQVGPEPYEALLAAWASAGYVVAAPELPLSDQAVAGANLDENDIVNEPGDLRFVLDSLVASGSPLAAEVDPTRVALAGHSDGAEAALAASIDPTPAGEPIIRAVIAMSVSPLPGSGSLASPPALVTQGDADPINPDALGRQVFDSLRSPKFFLDLLGGGHLPPVEAGSAWLPTIQAVSEDFLNLYIAGNGSLATLLRDGDHRPLTILQSG